ncbi:unnamed protein product, partial [Aphanomyces euteiches]
MRAFLLSFVLATAALALNEDQHLGSHVSSGLKTRHGADDMVKPTALRQLGGTPYRGSSSGRGGFSGMKSRVSMFRSSGGRGQRISGAGGGQGPA